MVGARLSISRSTESRRFARENFLQLLTIETVFVHHFVDELLGIRVISEIAAHLHHIVLRLSRKPPDGVPVVVSVSVGFGLLLQAASNTKREAMLHNDA